MTAFLPSSSILEPSDDQRYRLDIRTVTMGINLPLRPRHLREPPAKCTTWSPPAEDSSVCRGIEAELGIPIVNKRISVTPVALVSRRCQAATRSTSPVRWTGPRQPWA